MIDVYVDNITKSLEIGCDFSALSLSLILPDICGMVEHPNKDVGERYIDWCDKYICTQIYEADSKGLSGESIYNLRNTFLHQGSPNINTDKIKDNANRVDKFLLVIGKKRGPLEMTINLSDSDGRIVHRAEAISVAYLCETICDSALKYYNDNKDRFSFNFNAISSNEFVHEDIKQSKPIEEVVNSVFSKPETISLIDGYIASVVKDKELTKDNTVNNSSITNNVNISNKQSASNAKTKKKQKKKMSVEESKARSYFGRHFRKKIYIEKKEEILNAVLSAKSMRQVKSNLYKIFKNEEAGIVYGKLVQLLKDLKLPAK